MTSIWIIKYVYSWKRLVYIYFLMTSHLSVRTSVCLVHTIVSEHLGKCRLLDHCSVYQTEIIAIIELGVWLKHNVLTKVMNIWENAKTSDHCSVYPTRDI